MSVSRTVYIPMIQGGHIHSSRTVEFENESLARDSSDDECVTNCIHTDECVTNCVHTHTHSRWHIRQWMRHDLIRDPWMCHDLYRLIRVRDISDNECATSCRILHALATFTYSQAKKLRIHSSLEIYESWARSTHTELEAHTHIPQNSPDKQYLCICIWFY